MEYLELYGGAHIASFNTDDRRLLEWTFLFVEHNFGDRAAFLSPAEGYSSLTLGTPGDRITIAAFPDGRLEVRLGRVPLGFLMADFTHAVMQLMMRPGGTFEIRLELPGRKSCLEYNLDFPQEEFGHKLREFKWAFSEGGNE